MSTTLAEQNRDLLNAGLIDQNAALTATGSRLLERSETAGEDPDEMLDFYLKGWIDADLNLTQDGNIWEGVMERGLEDILSEPNQEKGFQLYQQAKNNGALSYYKTQAGEEYEDMVQFLEHAAKNFAPMAGQLFGELVKVPGGLAQTYEVAQRSLPWYFQTPAGWLLGAIKGKPTEEELAANKVRIDAYAKEALLRMPATMSYGAHAALTHHPVTGKLFTDEDRLRSAYLYRKAQFDIEQVETGTAVAAAIDFGATMATTVADVATLGLQSEELEELIEDFREKNIYGDEGVEARVKGAEQQLNELDRIEGNDPDLPWYQRPSQTKTRAEIAKETGTAVGMILSPDTLTPFAFAALGRSAVTATMRKSMQLSGELVELQGKRQLLQSSQKAAAASPFGKGAASQLQRQIDNIDGTITATEKRLLRVSQAIEPRLLSAVGAMGRKIRSVPFKASGAALQSAGTLLKRMNPALSGLTQGAAFYGLTGGNPFIGALGVIAGMTGQGGRTFALGQRLSKVGLEWGKRRTALPFFRKLADESKDSVFRRQLFLAGDFALGKPVRMTRQFADYYRRAFIAEVPFSYIAAGGASYAGGNWLTDAMAEALAFEAPMAMGANVTGSLMGMKTAGTVEEQNRLATNAALNFRDEFLRDPEKRAVFDALPPVAKRALGNYHTAFPDLHWDFDVSVANGSSYYDSDSNTIRINPNDPRGAEAAMAHEFRHYLDAQGFEQGVVDELVGPSGILRLKDGSYMPDFVTWANNENKLRGDKWDLSRNDSSDWAEAALEWSAYSSMDGLASSVRHNALIKATQRHPWMRSLMDAIMPASYRQKSLMNMGLLFDSDGTVSVRKGLPGRDAYKQQAAIAKRVQRYMRDRAGIGATDADRADLHDPEKSKKDPNAILPNDQEGLNQVESVMTPDLEHDAQGNVILKNGEAQLIPQETADARAGEGQPLFGPQLEQESNVSLPKVNVGRGTDNGTDLTGVAKMHGASPTGALVGAARLKEMLRSLPFSDYQLEMFDEIVDILSDPSRRGESLLSFYFPVWRKKRGKGNWRNFVPKKGIAGKWGRWAPYALVQSDEGNLLVYGISHDQVAENIAILAKSASGRKLYDGNVGRIASDFELMVTNWGKDIKNITQFTDEQLNFLNAIFGNVGKGNPDFNPALLEAPFKKLRSAVRSYRLDRFARIQTLPRDPFPFALEKGRRRELPPEDLENYQGTHKAPTGEYGEGSLDAMDKTYPSDIYGPNGARYYGDGGDIDREAHRIIVAAKGNPTKRVKVYRAVPGNVDPETKINPGDWVTTVRGYAERHGERFDEGSTILEAEVEAQEIFTEGNSIFEFGYMPKTQTASDADYLAAVEAGDTDAAQRMVDDAAVKAGYASPKVYHGTDDEFTVFASQQSLHSHSPDGFFFTEDLEEAKEYGSNIVQAYLKLESPLTENNAQFKALEAESEKRGFGEPVGDIYAKAGHDSIVLRANLPNSEYTVFSRNQIKSADPITYDDQGNVIPLSRRFDTGDDIRGEVGAQFTGDADYLAAVEAGDMEAAQRMVDDAAVKAGMVKAAHGMVGELEGNTFDRGKVGSRSGASRGGFSFTTDTDAAKAYALSSNEEADVLWWAQKTNEILGAIPETSQAEVDGTSIKEVEWDTGAMDIDENALAQIPDDIRYIADAIREHEPKAAAKLDSLAKKSPPQDRKGKVVEVYLSLNNAQTVQASIGAFGQDLWGVKATSESDVIVETDNGEKVYYVYSPSSIKSADPVTRDDQGNVIPLSRRFDTGEDIRGEVGRPTTPVAQPGGRREMPLEQPDQHGMRSPTVEKLSEKVQGKRASADQLRALISAKKGLVNQEEVKWLGIDQLVDSMDKSFGGKIPVQEFFAEVRRRSEAGLVAVERSDRAVFEKRKATKADVLEAREETNEGPPAFESYVTHLEQGQEEYRETVLVSPNAQDWSVEQVHAYGNDLLDNKRIAASLAFVRPNEKNEYGLMIEEAQSDRHQHGYNNGYLDDQGGLGADELETLVNDTQAEIDEVGLQIEAATESHPFLEWQNANIGETEEAASMRLGEEAPEIDHLRNTDTGYVAPYHHPARSVMTLQRQNAEAPGSKIFAILWSKPGRKLPIYSEYQKQRGEYDKFIQPLMQRKKELHKKRRDLRRAIRDRERLTGDAPFRNPAAWYVALFKRGLQQAVNEDLEWIGWWEGKVANDRWGLVANDIERLVWDQRYLAVYRTNQPVRSVPAEDSERLTELLGPDLGEQLYQKGVDHWNNISERADELVVEEVASLAQERAQYEIDEEGADPDGFEERVLELVAEDFEYDVARDRAETMAESELGGGDITLEQDEIQKSDVDLTPYYDKHFVNGVNKYLKRLPAKLTQSKMPHPKFEEATARYFKVDITPELRKKIKEEGQTRW